MFCMGVASFLSAIYRHNNGNLSACGKRPTNLLLGICATLDRQLCLWQEYFNAKVAKERKGRHGCLRNFGVFE